MANLKSRVLGYHVGGSAFRAYRWDLVSTLAYVGYDVDPATGSPTSLHAWNTTSLIDVAHQSGAAVVLTVQLMGAVPTRQFLSVPAARATLIESLITAVKSRNGDGVNIDFEGVPGDQRANLVTFFKELSTALRTALPKAEISAALPAVDFAHAYDVAAIDALCDYVLVMGYDYAWSTGPTAGPVAPLSGGNYNVIASIQTHLKAGVQANRLLLGVPYYGYDWPTASADPRSKAAGSGHAYDYVHHTTAAAAHGRKFDPEAQSPWYCYTDGGQGHVAWYEDAVSLAAKYAMVTSQGLGGIGIWTVAQGGGKPELWSAIETAFSASDT